MSRELDRRVAVEVMEWELVACSEDGIDCPGHYWRDSNAPSGYGLMRSCSCDQDVELIPDVPLYSTSWAAAGEVVEKMRGDDWCLELNAYDDGDGFHCLFYKWGEHSWHESQNADTAPLAICKAALAAKEAENE